MTTREMLNFMKINGYSLRLLANQGGVSYFKVYRHLKDAQHGANLSFEDKAALWRFALAQPVLFEYLHDKATAENKDRQV